MRRCEAAVKLVVRSSPSLESKKVGDLMPGAPLIVMEELCVDGDSEGVLRARVGKDSTPRGVCINPIGWVTTFKDGESKLLEDESGTSPRDASPSASRDATPGRARPKLGLPPPDWSFERMDLTPTGGSMASRIAWRRQETAKERHVRVCATLRDPSPPFVLRDASPRPSSPLAGRVGTSTAAELAASGSRGGTPAMKRKGGKRSEVLLRSEKLLETVATLLVEADAEGAQTFDTVSSKIGKLLVEKNIQPAELMHAWDRNKDVSLQRLELCSAALPP